MLDGNATAGDESCCIEREGVIRGGDPAFGGGVGGASGMSLGVGKRVLVGETGEGVTGGTGATRGGRTEEVEGCDELEEDKED